MVSDGIRTKQKLRICILICLAGVLLCSVTGCRAGGESVQNEYADVTEAELGEEFGTDIDYTNDHEDITWDLIILAEHDQELKGMLEKSILQAKKMNPDPDMNPVSDLESYYDFIDFCYKCMPWEICPSDRFVTLYDRIDQGMGCLYFICDQPLDELEDRGYYHNSLMYHEPYRSWFIRFLSETGQYLSTEASWNEEYYQNALENTDFHLNDDTYESPENWKSFNDFFARRLKDPSLRPIAAPEDESVIVSPADAVPQGIWKIDENSKIIGDEVQEKDGISIKTGELTDVSVLLGESEYRNAFRNGAVTHTFLDVNDYHRYHVPVSGTIRDVLLIPQDDAPGGVITWDKENNKYVEYYSGQIGWQSIETRGVVVIETDSGGFVAIVPVGMCQVSSVNFEDTIVKGAKVKKGDPLGYFLFGGSDIVMIFSEDLRFDLTAEKDEHILMGNEYGRILFHSLLR